MSAQNTQKEMVLRHLQDFGSITSWEAIQEYGATRLSGIIYSLRQEGYKIISQNEKTINRYGKSVKFAKYTLADGGATN